MKIKNNFFKNKNLLKTITICFYLILSTKNLEAAKPVASDMTPPAFNEDTESIIYLIYSDADGDKATACGTKSLNSVTETTTCNCDVQGICSLGVTGLQDYYGSASFQFRVIAGAQPSNWANANLTIISVNDPPVISEILDKNTDEDTPIIVNFTITDVDHILTCSSTNLSASSSNTILVKTSGIVFGGSAPNCTATITPEENMYGDTDIIITVTDGEDEAQSPFTLTVNPVDDPPIANAMSVDNFNKDTESPYITLDYIDYDGDKATSCSLQNLTNVTESTSCACDLDGICKVKVTGTGGYSGSGSFEFNVTANSVTSNWALASFTIIDPSTPPTISSITNKTMNENDTINIGFTVSNASCSSESLSMSSSNETIVPNTSVSWSGIAPDCTATITPLYNKFGTPEITFTATNASGSNSESFTLTIIEVDDPPIAQDISPASFNEDTESMITLSYSDPEGDLASACRINSVTNVTVTTSCACSGGVCTVGVQGTQDYYGSASFTYSVIANGLESNSATANLTIINVNDPPTISSITDKTTDEDISILINFTINDVDNNLACSSLYLSMETSDPVLLPNSHVIWSGTAPNCSAQITTSKDNYGYVDEIKFIVSDGMASDFTTFALTVNPVDDAPEAYDIYPPMLTMNTEEFITLSYFDAEDDLATSCSVSNLINVRESTGCSCDVVGICTVGITGNNNFTGEGHFDFNVTANGKISNSASTAKLLIDVTFMSGTLDSAFDTDGYFIHNSLAGGDEHDIGHRGVIHEGNIYIVGSSYNSHVQGRNMALWNVSSTGTLSGSFTHNGAAGGSGFDGAYAIGKYFTSPPERYFFYIFGVSTNANGNKDIAIWKLQERTGTLDTSFNSTGYKTFDGAAGVSNSTDLLFDGFILSGNYLIATGASENSSGYFQTYLLKTDMNGNPDYSFGGTGFINIPSTTRDEFGKKISVQSNGKYIILGDSFENGDYKDVKIWRINVNGTLDTTFATGGVYTLSASGNDSYAAGGLHVDYDNNISISGDKWDVESSAYKGFVLRLDTHGVPYAHFNSTGYYETGIDSDESYTSILVQADGYIIMGGYEWIYNGIDYETNLKACRLTDAGILDTSFGISGCETHDSAAGGNDWDYVNSLLLSEDNYSYLYAIGASYNANENYDMTIWSFE